MQVARPQRREREMERQLKRPKALLGLLITLAVAVSMVMPMPALAQPPLNGDVEADFTGPGVVIIPDTIGEFGLPGNAPAGTISGWDMKDLRLYYHAATNTMYVGINVGSNSSTILGDADGDGNPGGTSAWLTTNGGTDYANLAQSETAAVYFDLNEDGTWDVIAGISGSADYSGFSVNIFTGSFFPPNNFGVSLPGNTGSKSANPDSTHPDLEFTITNWSTLPQQDGDPLVFCVGAFLGSQQDDGIGEDFLYYCEEPCIDVQKTVDCNNDTVFLDQDWGIAGDTAHWRVVVTNCGNCNLTNIMVTDDNGHDFGPAFNLSIGAPPVVFNYDTVVNVDTTNWAYVTGYAPTGAPVSDEDSATNYIRREVGGIASPVDKLRLIAPWAVLLGCSGVVTLLMLRKRRQA
jgi:hypothetical protein